MKKAGSATDPLWYKDAIIYELHVRAFQDSNADGIGDFPGLMSRLDYLQDLGVTCLWLLPFFPSPLRDDGYDIANYVDVNPSYGTLDEFKQFLDGAHQRGMQVMIELVVNHTSDQHPWFQAARLAPPGSPERNMYVWSDTDQLYKDARIIFTDTEKSNWTWDEIAKQYYWHRFFSHQPDLNFDNPVVIEEVLKAMRFWLDMGVDALRMDAIPYLVERDGTNCENLPETHAAIKKFRAAIDADYSNRLILAEANQWPPDVLPYFGNGDECHMAFHFPLMPRIYMALRQEDRLPITDIMAQTPDIPESCQWGLFLRNHDELTLEMVTDDERDYMYLAYSADPRMRINVGIRRRLAPLVDNNRRRIELLNSLLLSFPGTPILYYGDEIGMGDNIYLGDRNGVRTPMQWNSDRNAGFSKAVPAKLYFPVIMDPIWGYQAINVEAQQSDPSSLLHWSRNMIALRKLFQVFGRGTLEFLEPENRKILAYVRRFADKDGDGNDIRGQGETVLCVANLSRFAQPVSLDLAEFDGMLPVEMLGYVPFPQITKTPYALSIAPYSFLWLELQPAPEKAETPVVEVESSNGGLQKLDLLGKAPGSESNISSVLTGPGLNLLQLLLPNYLQRQRWFGAKTRTITTVRVLDSAPFPRNIAKASGSQTSEAAKPAVGGANTALVFLELTYDDSSIDTYQLPLAIATGETAAALRESAPNAILATVNSSGSADAAVLYDATANEDFRQYLLTLIETSGDLPTAIGRVHAQKSAAFAEARGEGAIPARTGSAEQSNTSILYDARLILKLFRRLQPGENPDTEIGRFLTEVAHFPRIAPFLGDIRLVVQNGTESGEPTTLAMLQGLVQNEGDGWQWTLDEISRYYDSCVTCPLPHDLGHFPTFTGTSDHAFIEPVREYAGLYIDAAGLLGRRTAEMHLALATPTDDPAFLAEPFAQENLGADAVRIEEQIARTLEALRRGMANLPSSETDNTADSAALILSQRRSLLARARMLTQSAADRAGLRTRIHGDYHLGQILRTKADFVILDFEGEPARPLAERRAKQSPLKDVAGMLRSFSYAAYSGLNAFLQRRPPNNPADARNLESWATLWQNAVSTEFLGAYRSTVAQHERLMPEPAEAQLLLNAYLLEKALYELLYELNNRPAWVRIPLAGILALPQ
ncbi:MAG TPA: maltose alpha-D-glucosyltransferase [Granulicella sp.]|nr:maltose alpha-D-glucosyltransferase [Granulicella sp.]